jgi:hypothetical protein
MVPIISTESPFRRMPVDMPRRQILYFDALRLSAEMAGLAFERLEDLLRGLSQQQEGLRANEAVRALVDAYSVIDAVHRFRDLIQVTPGLKHNSAFQLFMRQTEHVRDLRRIVQHLNREVDRIAREAWAALGTLTWLGPSAVHDGPPTSYILQAGTFYAGQWTHGPMIDTYSCLPEGQISDISLATAGFRVNLSAIVHRLRIMVQSLEGPLEAFAAGKERFGSDVLLSFRLTPVKETEANCGSDASRGRRH